MSSLTIGKVKLNLINCESEASKSPFKEDLLRIVKDRSPLEYNRILAEKSEELKAEAFPYVYHLSDMRANIARWLPIEAGERVLETNAECGAITGALLEFTDNVTSITGCAADAEILAERYSACNGLVIYAGNEEAVIPVISAENQRFDWILTDDAKLLNKLKPLLSIKGRIVFMTDNRMGMRNLSGVKAFNDTEYFTGIEGKEGTGFTYAGIHKLLAITGFKKAQMYYPYPDFRFLRNLYSNARPPKTGELIENSNNTNSDRIELFNEKEAFDASCEDGAFPMYSNSYLVVIGEPLSIEFARFSNDRASEYAIFTTIDSKFGKKIVRKQPITPAAIDHVKNMAESYKKLEEKYAGSRLHINKCNLLTTENKIYADFEYVKGIELASLLDRALMKEDLEDFYKLFDKYVRLTGYNDSYPFTDIDLVFSNILIDPNKDIWTLTDYEWCKEGSTKVRETAYRAIYCYLLENPDRKKFNLDLLLDKLVLSREAAAEIERDEEIFQKKVNGRNITLPEIKSRMGFGSFNPLSSSVKINNNSKIYKFRIYPGGSHGEFSEETAFDIKDAYISDTQAEATIPVMIEDLVMRVDPLNAPCIVTILEAKLGEADFPVDSKKYVVSNGKRAGKETFIFKTQDPNLYFNIGGFFHNEDTFLYLKLDIIPVSELTAGNLEGNIKRIF